jgi:hypothetical protein
MAELAIVILGSCAVFFLIFGKVSSAGKEARLRETPAERDLEDSFIELKAKAFAPEARDDELAYQRLLYRINAVLRQIVERHMRFVFDVEANTPNVRHALRLGESDGAADAGPFRNALLRDLDIEFIDPEVLVYLCYSLYLGGNVKDVGKVQSDPELMLRILDPLVGERGYPPAQFFKGLVMKYGVSPDLPGDLAEARRLLRKAERNGFGPAGIELTHLSKHAPLRGIGNGQSRVKVSIG